MISLSSLDQHTIIHCVTSNHHTLFASKLYLTLKRKENFLARNILSIDIIAYYGDSLDFYQSAFWKIRNLVMM